MTSCRVPRYPSRTAPSAPTPASGPMRADAFSRFSVSGACASSSRCVSSEAELLLQLLETGIGLSHRDRLSQLTLGSFRSRFA